ncbi:hypothetical protein T484DRAFT_1809664, partial [Baffinella frigidus]
VDSALVGKCLVEFADVDSARKAAVGLNRVKFDDRVVETDFYGEQEMQLLKAFFPEQPQPAGQAALPPPA